MIGLLLQRGRKGETYAYGDADSDSQGGRGTAPVDGKHGVQFGVTKEVTGI
jgi:hypothetical protein